jgi:hypothetical protein
VLAAFSTQVPAPILVTPPVLGVVSTGIATLMMLSTVLVPPRISAPDVAAAILVMAPFRMTGFAPVWLA